VAGGDDRVGVDQAAMPPPKACSSSCATGCAGTRSPMVSWPPVTKSPAFPDLYRTSVSGPGHNFAASFFAPSGTSRAQANAWRASAKWTITGWSAGRRFAA
jgi:hypothetical protein